MDIRMAEIMLMARGPFILFWAAGIAAIVLYLALTRRHRERDWAESLPAILFAAIGAYVISCLIGAKLLDHYANKHLKEFSHQRITSLIIDAKEKEITIKDPGVINTLLKIMASARPAGTWHHSYPVEEISLFFPQSGYQYSLGKDSDVNDEYWLEWLRYRGSDPAVVSITVVKKFRSRALKRWLRNHVLSRIEQNVDSTDERP
jgi:hypothetical protein